jgi:hypothetical protein
LDVDLIDDVEENKIKPDLLKYNPRYSFPTVLIGEKVIIGFKEDEIREALSK